MTSKVPLLAAFAKDLYHCSDCNYCVDAVWAERGIDHVCPTLQHHSPLMSFSGRGYLAAARAWFEGQELDLDALSERVFTCTTCGNCEQICPIGLHPTAVGRALRGELQQRNVMPQPVRDLLRGMREDGNPNGVARSDRMAWQQARTSAAAEHVLYLPGCAAATAIPAEAQAAVELMAAAGYVVQTLENDDTCCGAPLFELGDETSATSLIEALAEKVRAASTVVISGLECARSWQRLNDANLQPVTFNELIMTALSTQRLHLNPRATLPPRVFVLDSCQSRTALAPGRALRQLLTALGIATKPSVDAARFIVCCGAAGGMPQVEPVAADRMADARLGDAGADAVVVGADPRCVAHLRRVRRDAGPRVLGLAEFLNTYFTHDQNR